MGAPLVLGNNEELLDPGHLKRVLRIIHQEAPLEGSLIRFTSSLPAEPSHIHPPRPLSSPRTSQSATHALVLAPFRVWAEALDRGARPKDGLG